MEDCCPVGPTAPAVFVVPAAALLWCIRGVIDCTILHDTGTSGGRLTRLADEAMLHESDGLFLSKLLVAICLLAVEFLSKLLVTMWWRLSNVELQLTSDWLSCNNEKQKKWNKNKNGGQIIEKKKRKKEKSSVEVLPEMFFPPIGPFCVANLRFGFVWISLIRAYRSIDSS